METINDFFISDNIVDNISEDDYKQADLVVNAVKALARLAYQSIYIVDYYKKNFLYVSDNPIFLCGLRPDEVEKMGYSFYNQQVPKDELKMLLEINRAGFDFYSKTPREERLDLFISYDFHMNDGGHNVLINHKLTPILLAPNGNIWLAACVVSLSSSQQAGNIEAHKEGCQHYWTYSMESRKWTQHNDIKLNEREAKILLLSVQGYNEKEVAKKIHLEIETIKFHKQKMFKKLDVDNIISAIAIATQKKLI